MWCPASQSPLFQALEHEPLPELGTAPRSPGALVPIQSPCLFKTQESLLL